MHNASHCNTYTTGKTALVHLDGAWTDARVHNDSDAQAVWHANERQLLQRRTARQVRRGKGLLGIHGVVSAQVKNLHVLQLLKRLWNVNQTIPRQINVLD